MAKTPGRTRSGFGPRYGGDAPGRSQHVNAKRGHYQDHAIGYEFRGRRSAAVVTPYTGMSPGGDDRRGWRTGTRWALASEASMGLETTRNAGTETEPRTTAFQLRTELRW